MSQQMTAVVPRVSLVQGGDKPATRKWGEYEVMRMLAMKTRDSKDRVLEQECAAKRGVEKMVVCGRKSAWAGVC